MARKKKSTAKAAAGAAAKAGTGAKARDAFFSYYRDRIGPRWDEVYEACLKENTHFRLEAGLRKPYFMDPASVLAALCLGPSPGDRVLDLCAAPGGKTLVLAQTLFGDGDSETGILLTANERSSDRRARLLRVLSDSLPAEWFSRVRVSGRDARTWGEYEKDAYDKILLDVPCSSERHLIQSQEYLEDWSPARSRHLAQQAYTMLLSAGRALKAGGTLLYATCALNDDENDGVVRKSIKRSEAQSGRFAYRLEPEDPGVFDEIVGTASGGALSGIEATGVETTEFGRRVWPDRSGGFGPLYFSRLKKVLI